MEHSLYGAVSDRFAVVVNLVIEQIFFNFHNSFSVGVHFKDFADEYRLAFVDLIMLVLVDIVAERNRTAEKLAFACRYFDSAPYLLREFNGIVFRHAFQHALDENTARIFRDIFFGGKHAHAVLFEFCLVGSAVVTVAGKTV